MFGADCVADIDVDGWNVGESYTLRGNAGTVMVDGGRLTLGAGLRDSFGDLSLRQLGALHVRSRLRPVSS